MLDVFQTKKIQLKLRPVERRYLPPLVFLIQQPGLQLSHHDLPLPLGDGPASLIMSGHQAVDVRQVGLFSGKDHHLVLRRCDILAKESVFKGCIICAALTACPVKTPDSPDCFSDVMFFMSPRSFFSVRSFVSNNIFFSAKMVFSIPGVLEWWKPLITIRQMNFLFDHPEHWPPFMVNSFLLSFDK